MKSDEWAIICDYAEYYHIYNYKALPLSFAAVLFFGLRAESRSKTILNGSKLPIDLLIRSMTLDNLRQLVWFQSKDGAKGRNRPPSLTEMMLKEKEPVQNEILSFDSGEDFERERERRIKKWLQS